jgi:hypothetical protein
VGLPAEVRHAMRVKERMKQDYVGGSIPPFFVIEKNYRPAFTFIAVKTEMPVVIEVLALAMKMIPFDHIFFTIDGMMMPEPDNLARLDPAVVELEDRFKSGDLQKEVGQGRASEFGIEEALFVHGMSGTMLETLSILPYTHAASEFDPVEWLLPNFSRSRLSGSFIVSGSIQDSLRSLLDRPRRTDVTPEQIDLLLEHIAGKGFHVARGLSFGPP